jgi:hypothetical protein
MLRNLQKAAGYGIPFLLRRLQRPANECRIMQPPPYNKTILQWVSAGQRRLHGFSIL